MEYLLCTTGASLSSLGIHFRSYTGPLPSLLEGPSQGGCPSLTCTEIPPQPWNSMEPRPGRINRPVSHNHSDWGAAWEKEVTSTDPQIAFWPNKGRHMGKWKQQCARWVPSILRLPWLECKTVSAYAQPPAYFLMFILLTDLMPPLYINEMKNGLLLLLLRQNITASL